MNEVAQIGRCKGCDRLAELDDGVCHECLVGPARGRKWAEMVHRCRVEPSYAAEVYRSLRTENSRKFFILMFGMPNGIRAVGDPTDTRPVAPVLQLRKS